MKPFVHFLSVAVLCVACLLGGCGDNPRATALLSRADSLMASRPDSALLLLDGCEAEATVWPESQQMRHRLLQAKARNKAYVPFTSDSVMAVVADYYDRNGTANEQIEAHYLLGCVYRDLKEVPHAIDCYLDAIAKADTTEKDCDFRTLSSVYSQIADLYHQQLLLSYEIVVRRQAQKYALLAHDTLRAISDLKLSASAYILNSQEDTAEIILQNALNLYKEHGYIQEGIQSSTMLMALYAKHTERCEELKSLIDRFEAECDLFDSQHELHFKKRQFYYYKGRYYEMINNLDSAEYYYRKVYYPNMAFVAQNSMYKGLLSVFNKRFAADSIAKYAKLYCMANDSSIALKDQEQTARLAASYNYTHYQKEARKSDAKVHKREVTLILFAVFVGIIAVITIFLWNRNRKNQQIKRERIEAEHKEILNRLREEHRKVSEAYADKLEQLQQAERKHKRTINTIQLELGRTQSENQNMKTENVEAKHIIEQLNLQHEEEAGKLKGSIASYKEKVEELERQISISGYKQKSTPFLDLGIVKRVFLFAKDSQKQLSHSDIKLLIDAVHDYYPDLICDLNAAHNVSELGRIVCVLVAMHLQPNEITHLLNISPQQVGNLKKNINIALFHESTALTLYRNLSYRYKVPSYPKM